MEMLVLGASHFVCAALKRVLRRRCWFVFSLDGSEDVGAARVPASRQSLDARFHPYGARRAPDEEPKRGKAPPFA